MESFSLLKYWKNRGGGGSDCCSGGGGVGGGGGGGVAIPHPGGGTVTTTTTIVTAVGDHAGDSDSDGGGDDDEGPFFDLEFAVPADDDDADDDEESLKFDKEKENVDDDQEEESDVVEGGERGVKFRLSSSTSSCDNLNPNLSLSPSDDLFFKGRIVRMDGSDEITSKSDQFPIPVSLLRSATRFRVFMLNLKRSKSESTTTTATAKPQNPPQTPPQKNINKKLFTVKMKFKAEDVPILSLLTRASSNSKFCTATATATSTAAEKEPAPSLDSIDEKRQKKEVIQKYLKLVKPLYIGVSKRKPAEVAVEAEAVEEVVKEKGQKQGMKLKEIAKKHLGKSKTAVVHSMPNVAPERRDDSLMQQQDGIQSAILHCKRSFNASTEGEEQRVHDACQEKKKTTTAVEELEGNDDV